MNEIKKINVGVFSDVYYPMIDGVVKVMSSHVKHLHDRVNFYLIVPSAPEGFEEIPFGEKEIIRTKSVKLFFLDYEMPTPKFDRKLKEKLKNIKLDAVVVHSSFGIGKLGIKYARKNKIPSIIYAHSQLKQDFKRAVKLTPIAYLMTKYAISTYNKASMVVSVGEGVNQLYINDYGLKNRSMVISNATDLVYLEDQKIIDEVRKEHNLHDPDELIFSFVGRINKLKGIYLIADSLKLVQDENIKYKMIFVGTGQDLDPFKEYCQKIGIIDNVIFPGSVSSREKLAAYYQIADLFLFPSMYDTNSLVQKEASSQKTPPLFARGSLTSYGLKEGVHGFFADYDAKSFAGKIIELANDRKQLTDMREIVYKNAYWTWENSANKLYDLILELIEENNKKTEEK